MSHIIPASDNLLDHPFDLSIVPEDMGVNQGAIAQSQAMGAVLFAQKGDLDEDRCFFQEQQPDKNLCPISGAFMRQRMLQ